MKRILSFLIVFGFTASLYAQFISNLGKEEEKYINLSGRNYENYSSKIEKKKFFDNFGNFLIEGYPSC